mmetsp:Transcript_5642/g.8763  ORF Transcript_5642/g.8763 Transcript_5642/m.8763 type:complete len:384 (+) Transcript_5642:53-1204(+)
MGEDKNRNKKKPGSAVAIEFATYFGGTFAALYVADKNGWLFEGRSAVAMFPEVSWWRVLTEFPGQRALFALYGVVLALPMHFWRNAVKSIFTPLATKGAGLQVGTVKCQKFLEQCWLATHYSIVTVCEIGAVMKATELWPPMVTEKSRHKLINSFEDKLGEGENIWVQGVYLVQFTFYFLELATLVLDKRARARSDAFVYLIHHVVTVMLISFSYIYSFVNIGLLVLLFHDVGDIFLPIAKCFVYSEDHVRVACSKRSFRIVLVSGVFFFVLFMIVFGLSRLVLYPTMIYTAVFYGKWYTRIYDPAIDGATPATQDPSAFRVMDEPYASAPAILVVELLLLFGLHVYWFRLILRVAYRAVMGIYDDERSDDEDESYEPHKKNE